MSLLFEIKENIGLITLNRPDKFNSVIRELALAFQDSLDECNNNDEVRAIYITGNGRAFAQDKTFQKWWIQMVLNWVKL